MISAYKRVLIMLVVLGVAYEISRVSLWFLNQPSDLGFALGILGLVSVPFGVLSIVNQLFGGKNEADSDSDA